MPSPGKNSADGACVEILISTYNGASFIVEQLDSIAAQTYTNWSLIARDDGSTDETVGIIEEFGKIHPDRVRIIDNKGKRLGACGSFAALLEMSTAPYVMFSDQDDVWMADKIEATLKCMRDAEDKFPDAPVLVHTDMEVVDSKLKTIAGSFWRYQNLDPNEKSLNTLIVHNNVTGCAMMANRALADAAVPVPGEAILHDWWAALVAAGLGRIEHIDRPLIKYRQHGANEAGAVRYSLRYFTGRLGSLGRTTDLLKRVIAQARALNRAYSDRLRDADREIVREFSTVLERPRLIRPWVLIGRGIRARGALRNLGINILLAAIAPGRGPGRAGGRPKERS